MTRAVPNPPNRAIWVGRIVPRRKVHITVLFPAPPAVGIISLAKDRDTLESPPPFGAAGAQPAGIPVTNATGTAEIEWLGDLWAIGDPTNPAVPRVEFDL